MRILRVLAAALCAVTALAAAAIEPAQLRSSLETLSARGSAEASYHLGMLYNNGIGGAADPRRAYALFEQAASAGDPLGAYKQGCYLVGQFPGAVALDEARGLALKRTAAAAGYSAAQYDVAVHHLKNKDHGQAQPLLQNAADQGDPQALYALSSGHGLGWWGTKDLVRSYAYFKLAKLVSEGQVSERAQAGLDGLAKQMAPEDLARAQGLVRDWRARPTALTQKARQGLSAAEALVASKD